MDARTRVVSRVDFLPINIDRVTRAYRAPTGCGGPPNPIGREAPAPREQARSAPSLSPDPTRDRIAP